MAIDKNDYPLELLKGIEPLLKKFLQLEFQYIDIVKREKKTEKKKSFWKVQKKEPDRLIDIAFIPRNKNLEFYFRVNGIEHLPLFGHQYNYEFKPASESETKPSLGNSNGLSKVEARFIKWVHMIKGYNDLKLTDEDLFLNRYANEFYSEFKNVGSDFESKPFSEEQQKVVITLLSNLEQELAKLDGKTYKTNEVADDISELRNAIPDISQSAAIKGFARILAKIKIVSAKVLKDVFDVIKKEVIKKALYGGLDEITMFYHHFL